MPAAFGRLLAPDNPVLQGCIAQATMALHEGVGTAQKAAGFGNDFTMHIVNRDIPGNVLEPREQQLAGVSGSFFRSQKMVRFLANASLEQAQPVVEFLLDRIAVEKDSADTVHTLCRAHAQAKNPDVKQLIEDALQTYGVEGYHPKFKWNIDSIMGMGLPALTATLSVALSLASVKFQKYADLDRAKGALAVAIVFGAIAVIAPLMGWPYRRYALMPSGEAKPNGNPATETAGA